MGAGEPAGPFRNNRRVADRQADGGREGSDACGVLQQVFHLARVVRDDEVRQAVAVDIGDLHIVGMTAHGNGRGGAVAPEVGEVSMKMERVPR